MKRQSTFLIAMIFSSMAILCYIAGQPRFEFLSPQVAKFGGIGLTLVAGAFWATYGIRAGRGGD